MGEVDGIGNRVRVRRINRNKFVAFAHFQLAKHSQICAWPPLSPDPRLIDHLDERTCTAIEISASEDNPRARWGRQNAQGDRSSAVESDAAEFHRTSNCSFLSQAGFGISLIR